ncbi:PREDICTED: uncharacterized protein LOC105456909 [Wasmannia auropunctata]|uniref:uncharacterized protein LOC105456909 n=1 Tax=Wasmannia auropunctata TaxID=64793 RepID=UPI0005F092F5|nr:PREDICTED: uncharacterized protein LOC105456909 [Wasmannia auropunctata]
MLQSEHWDKLQKHDYFKEDLIGDIETMYIEQRAKLLEIEKSLTASSSFDESKAKVKPASQRKVFPRIQLPQFSGRFEDWPAFRDLFQSIVAQETSLSKVEKLHYLKTCVKDDAEQLIRNIPSTEANFNRAWAELTDHFENKRLLVQSYLRFSLTAAFTALPKMKSDSAADLRRIFHGVVSIVGAIEGINRPITNCSDLFIHLAVELFDFKTRRDWENSLGRSAVPPSYEELKDFLQEQVVTQEVLEAAKTDRVSAGRFSTRNHHARKPGQELSRLCPVCEQNHFIIVCPQYKQKSAAERRDIVIAHRLCLNCGIRQMTARLSVAALNATLATTPRSTRRSQTRVPLPPYTSQNHRQWTARQSYSRPRASSCATTSVCNIPSAHSSTPDRKPQWSASRWLSGSDCSVLRRPSLSSGSVANRLVWLADASHSRSHCARLHSASRFPRSYSRD